MTTAILDERFPKIPREGLEFSSSSPTILDDECTPETIVHTLPLRPLCTRLAYVSFFCVQLFVLLHSLFFPGDTSSTRRRCSILGNLNACSLGVVFFIASREPFSTELGSSLQWVFLLHNIICFLFAVFRLVGSREACNTPQILDNVTGFLHLVWTICGAVALRTHDGRGNLPLAMGGQGYLKQDEHR